MRERKKISEGGYSDSDADSTSRDSDGSSNDGIKGDGEPVDPGILDYSDNEAAMEIDQCTPKGDANSIEIETMPTLPSAGNAVKKSIPSEVAPATRLAAVGGNHHPTIRIGTSTRLPAGVPYPENLDKIKPDAVTRPSAAAVPEKESIPSETYRAVQADNSAKNKVWILGSGGETAGSPDTGSFYNKGDNRITCCHLVEDFRKKLIFP
jgi:hypothetical protein